MKNKIYYLWSVVGMVLLWIAKFSVNSTCLIIVFQEKLPPETEKLKRFK